MVEREFSAVQRHFDHMRRSLTQIIVMVGVNIALNVACVGVLVSMLARK